ncbi:hypothetical protein D9615_004679 [Tricholomella constricta]|uniref:Uncharacterized protein n=1 Tax=Tricholomella constricta TaxID=117010 RepID=A0A8H5HCA8_9AGAR|nr:hypothetical protein D9615_004679 [Tricholomella constricta]
MRPPSQVPTILSPCRLQQARLFHSGGAVATQKAHAFRNPRGKAGMRDMLVEEPNSAVLRGKKFLHSPADALAVIRAVERKYGAVREYRFTRDFELPSNYQLYVNVAFRDPKAFERIPLKPESFTVALPSTISNRPGGVGLDDLEPVLQPQEYVDLDIPTFGNVMDDAVVESGKEETTFTIERTGNIFYFKVFHIRELIAAPGVNWYTPSSASKVSPSEGVAQSFINWGGFHELTPIPAETPIPTSEIFRLSAISHARMRRALRTHSETLRIPNPYEIVAANTNASASKLDWEPLPGHESAPTDTPMPSTIQAETGQPHIESQPCNSAGATSQSTAPTPALVADTAQPSTLPETSTAIPASVSEAEAIAARMARPPSRPMQTSPPKKQKKPQRQGQGQKPSQKSLRDLRNQALHARQSQSANREPTTPATVKDKISSFFSNIF